MNSSFLIIFGLTLFLLSAALVRVFCAYAFKFNLLDVPNARSTHVDVTPRGGGVIFVLLWLFCLIFAFIQEWVTYTEFWLLLPTTFIISLLGYWDDHQGLTVRRRFIIQVGVAMLAVALLGAISTFRLFSENPFYLGSAALGLGVLGLVWSTNLYNFMDGLDGIAAVEALFVFGVGGYLFWQEGSNVFLLAWALVLGVGGFLVWNWPKARVFMGDVGSYCLGFLVALFALIGDQNYHIPITLWVILYGVFWFDATVTVLRRLIKGENISVAHRGHAFQRLYLSGFSAKQVLAGVVVLNSILVGIALFARNKPEFLGWGLLISVLILSGVYGIIEILKPMPRYP